MQSKKRFFKLSIIMVLQLFISTAVAQKNDKQLFLKYINAAKNHYLPTDSFEIDLQYNIYQEHTDTKPEEQYKGKIVVNKGDLYNKLHQTETIQFKDIQVKINHDEKAMLISKVSIQENIDILNFEKFIDVFDKVRVTEINSSIKCELIAPKITQLPYQRIELFFNKKDYTINKQVLYFFQKVNYTTNDTEKTSTPKMEIVFIKKGKISDASVLSQKKYVSIVNNKIQVAKAFKAYTIHHNYD